MRARNLSSGSLHLELQGCGTAADHHCSVTRYETEKTRLLKTSDFFIHGHSGVFYYTKAKIIAMARVVIHSCIFYCTITLELGFIFHFTWKNPKSLSWVCAAPLSQAQPGISAFLDNLHLKFSARITSIFNPVSPGVASTQL